MPMVWNDTIVMGRGWNARMTWPVYHALSAKQSQDSMWNILMPILHTTLEAEAGLTNHHRLGHICFKAGIKGPVCRCNSHVEEEVE